MTHAADADRPLPAEDDESGSARALTLHLLRMLETRMDAAGIALQSEVQSFSARLQLRLLAAGALFLAIWAGIVLLAIALPPAWRIPVLSAVVALFAIGAVWSQLAANRKVSSNDVGSMTWFLDGLKLDLDVLARSLTKSPAQQTPPPADRSEPNDLAA
ncbi:MAG TPA: hypothetical protein VGO61_16085 [Steroidobacteraceae bacterium]|nr:hypothetical protein [Steroidobacteraceae bacterium]